MFSTSSYFAYHMLWNYHTVHCVVFSNIYVYSHYWFFFGRASPCFFFKKKLVKINKTEHPWFEAKKARKGMKSKESKFNKRDDNE